VRPPIAIVYIDSYYTVNMIHASDIWVFMPPILGVFVNNGNRSDIEMDASDKWGPSPPGDAAGWDQ
jgi:hypothetical protein